eukprot:g6885.t1
MARSSSITSRQGMCMYHQLPAIASTRPAAAPQLKTDSTTEKQVTHNVRGFIMTLTRHPATDRIRGTEAVDYKRLGGEVALGRVSNSLPESGAEPGTVGSAWLRFSSHSH